MNLYPDNTFFGEDKTLTVTQFNTLVKGLIEKDPILKGTAVKGEISGFKRYPSGHLYFTVKDGTSSLSCVMFSSSASTLRFLPSDGMQVVISGSATVYLKDGRYQFYVKRMTPDGVGGLFAAYEKLKKKLALEGLFDEDRKKPLPTFPRRIGVVTSIAGAALHDIISVTGRRFPTAELYVYPSAVQGEDAPLGLVRAVEYFSQNRNVDVLIIGRGGGSMEDLWAFNDEGLARALFACPIPTVSAVGHETDFTICDFVCDRRAPTPSAAAELVVPEREELLLELDKISERLGRDLETAIDERKKRLEAYASSSVMQRPSATLEIKRRLFGDVERRFFFSVSSELQKRRASLEKESAGMVSLNPMAVLARGYGAVFDDRKEVVRSIGQVRPGDGVTVRLSDGKIKARVENTEG